MSGIVWLASYPKSGNTWFRVFLANLISGKTEPVDINQLDNGSLNSRPLFDDSLGWESSDLSFEEFLQVRLDVQEVAARGGLTFVKVHESFTAPGTHASMFSRVATRAAVYIIRNPLDVAVSFSHHIGKSLDESIELLNNPDGGLARGADRLPWQLPQPLGDWSSHVRSWVEGAGIQVHVVRYEDMKKSPLETFTAACEFLGIRRDPAAVRLALEHSKFETLKQQERAKGFRESVGGREFFRKGQCGAWREVLSPAQVAAIVDRNRGMMLRFGYLNPVSLSPI